MSMVNLTFLVNEKKSTTSGYKFAITFPTSNLIFFFMFEPMSSGELLSHYFSDAMSNLT